MRERPEHIVMGIVFLLLSVPCAVGLVSLIWRH